MQESIDQRPTEIPPTEPQTPTSVTNDGHQQALSCLFDRIGQLSTLPSVAGRVLEVADDEDANIGDLLRVIESDPPLALRVLRTVNSSYYGLPNRVADLNSAISLLGFREVRNLALTVYVARLFKEPGEYHTFTREGLWRHMVAVGTTARLISRVCNRAVPDEAYLAGLLHDVGLILIDQFMRRQFMTILDGLDENVDTCDREKEILTFNHADLGAFVARQSGFPERVAVAIEYHHRPSDYSGEHADLVNVVAVANYLASRKGICSMGIHNVAAPANEVYEGLGLQASELAEIWEELLSALSTAEVLAAI